MVLDLPYNMYHYKIGDSIRIIANKTCSGNCGTGLSLTYSIDNNLVTWADENGIFLYDLTNDTEYAINTPGAESYPSDPAIDGNNLVWIDNWNVKLTTLGLNSLDHINISPSTTQTVATGQSIQFTAQGQDVSNNDISSLTYTWSANTPDGLFMSNTPGDYIVKASNNGVDSPEVTVHVVSSIPIYRLYNTINGAYLYVRGDADKNHVMSTWSEFEYTDGVPAFYAPIEEHQSGTPIYRLYNTLNGAYLYVRGDADRNHVMSTWPEFEFTDGVPAFYAPLTNTGGLTPIYRLYNTLNGMYLYTRGEADRNHVIGTWPEFEFTDSVPAFYAALN